MRQAIDQDFASVLVLAFPRIFSRILHARAACAAAFAGLVTLVIPAMANADPKILDAVRPVPNTPENADSITPRESTAGQAKNFLSFGPIFGFTSHLETPTTGILGFEMSYVRYPSSAFRFGIGGFAQAQTVGFDHGRFAFGPQFNFMMFGTELGAYVEEASGKYATTVGVHASPFVSLGFFSAALRIGVPLSTLSAGDPYGIDLGLVCAMKMPIPLDGQLFRMAFH